MLLLLVAASLVAAWAGARALAAGEAAVSGAAGRVEEGLEALWDFRSIDDGVIADRREGEGARIDLRIADANAVRHSEAGLEVIGSAAIRGDGAPARLIEAVRRSGALTLEAWVHPARLDQSGPARIVTLSRDPNERNLTLGQDGGRFEVRLRTTKTSANGTPAVASAARSARAALQHVVYTRDARGAARIYIDGERSVEARVDGSTSNWDGGFRLALANELTGDRPWQGTLRLVAIYSRALSSAEVERNFRAGAPLDPEAEARARERALARVFELRIAPLLSKHCLECHDTTTRKGKLDLSRKAAALADRGDEPLLVPGKPAESLLWELVASDDMPKDRPPLSADEKTLLRQWIDDGAVWSLDAIDAAIYAHGEGTSKVFVQRLTVPEYIETVRRTLGVDVAKEARELLPRDQRADGFTNTAYNLGVDLEHVRAWSELAEIIAGRADVRALARKHVKSRELTDENVTKVIQPLGTKLLRAPLDAAELARYCGVSTTVAGAGGDFDEALRLILEAMLQSPRFLYRIERHRGDGAPLPLDSWELASRLSYMLWGGPPDDALLDAAGKGSLADRAEVEKHVRRMVADPRAVARSRRFIAEWLNLDRLDNLRPDPERFPSWRPELAADMRAETLEFFEEVAWKQGRPLAELLNARVTFVTPALARHYGLAVGGDGDAPARVDLSADPARGGLLTQGAVLTIGGENASMVTRGLFILHELLRGVVRDPPPCVDTTPVRTKPGLTHRASSEARLADGKCSGCHAKFEPPAFALERYDGLGAYRETDEHGNALRQDGDLLIPGAEKPVPFATAREMMDLLAGSERVAESFTWKVAQFALGRPLGAADAPSVAAIHRAASEGGGTYASLITAIALSDLVLSTRTEPAGATP